jgi:hypothetical protein
MIVIAQELAVRIFQIGFIIMLLNLLGSRSIGQAVIKVRLFAMGLKDNFPGGCSHSN